MVFQIRSLKTTYIYFMSYILVYFIKTGPVPAGETSVIEGDEMK